MSPHAEISRVNPTAFLFLVDQSLSMEESFTQDGINKPKSVAVADAINRIIGDIALGCSKGEGVRDYAFIEMITYGGIAQSGWGGALSGQVGVPISAVDAHPLRYEQRNRLMDDGAGGLIAKPVEVPVWVEPRAEGGTPMRAAFHLALDFLREWVPTHTNAYPPIVFNITDGASTDGDPAAMMQAIRQIATNDGNVVLANVHLSSWSQEVIRYPLYTDPLPAGDPFAAILRDNASPLLTPWVSQLSEITGRPLSPEHATFVYNASIVELIQLLNVGTQVALR